MNLDLRRVCQGSTNVSLPLDFLETSWVKHLKTWWKLGENNFQNLVKNWRKPWWISNTWWISKTWWKPGEFKKFSPKEQRHNGTKKRFTPPKFSKKRVLLFLRFTVIFGLNLVKFQNLVKTCWKPSEFPKPPWWISSTWCYETFW